MEGQNILVSNIITAINAIENYTFENKQNRYNNLKVITDYLRSELDNLPHELNDIERNNKIAKIEANVSKLTTGFQTYEFPTVTINENTAEVIVSDDKRLINSSVTKNDSQVLDNMEERQISSVDSSLFSVNESNQTQNVNSSDLGSTNMPGDVINQEVTSMPLEVPQISILDDDNSKNETLPSASIQYDKEIDINNNPQSFEFRPVENMEQAQDHSEEYAKKTEDMPLDEQALENFLNGNAEMTL